MGPAKFAQLNSFLPAFISEEQALFKALSWLCYVEEQRCERHVLGLQRQTGHDLNLMAKAQPGPT